MVETHSSIVMRLAIIVPRIVAVSVERMLAFTPLPSPSDSTSVESSSLRSKVYQSPQSVSPCLFRLETPSSMNSPPPAPVKNPPLILRPPPARPEQ